MKLPKTKRMYCKHCKKHTIHKVANVKERGRSTTHPLSRGSTKRMKARGLRRGYGNYGKYSKPAISKFKRTGAKTSKKTNLKYTCEECKKTQIQKIGIRAKKTSFE